MTQTQCERAARPRDQSSKVYPYLFFWYRQGRKGQLCAVTARGRMNSIRVEFEDGYRMITSGNAIRRAA